MVGCWGAAGREGLRTMFRRAVSIFTCLAFKSATSDAREIVLSYILTGDCPSVSKTPRAVADCRVRPGGVVHMGWSSRHEGPCGFHMRCHVDCLAQWHCRASASKLYLLSLLGHTYAYILSEVYYGLSTKFVKRAFSKTLGSIRIPAGVTGRTTVPWRGVVFHRTHAGFTSHTEAGFGTTFTGRCAGRVRAPGVVRHPPPSRRCAGAARAQACLPNMTIPVISSPP